MYLSLSALVAAANAQGNVVSAGNERADWLSFQVLACLIVLSSSPSIVPIKVPDTYIYVQDLKTGKPLISIQQQTHDHCHQLQDDQQRHQRIRNASAPTITPPCALAVKPTPTPAPRSARALPSGTGARAKTPSPRGHASVHLSICPCVAMGRPTRTSVRRVATGRCLLPREGVPSRRSPSRHKLGGLGRDFGGILMMPSIHKSRGVKESQVVRWCQAEQ
ncbi:hypothetical protein E4U33_002193 [Claviceps sp. LM78 group G4]|nr:hypothetical protein E4U33_002193 [Claviceps sp. LM78 group G4]